MEYSGTYSHNGNDKLGKAVSVINRPAGTTCPGASEWCSKFCYAKHGSYVRFGIQAEYAKSIIKLPNKLREICRIHASGDFDTVDYIMDTITMARAHPGTKFWAYTRSWNVPHLVDSLETLRAEPNVQLFASVDSGMPEPPADWRVAFIETDTRFKGMDCLEQNGKMPDCKSCGYCFRKPAGNVRFNIH